MIIKLGTDFSGIGAPEQALKEYCEENGHELDSVFACDIDKYARESFLANHETRKMYEDITTRDHSEVEQLDLYVAGFPCQAFSIAGKRKGFEDVRGTLFFYVAEFIKINGPECFILENVKGLLSHDSGRTFQTIIDLLSNCGGTVNGQMSLDFFEDGLGYHIYYQVLNTKEHGIPQNRERIFIVGFRDSRSFSFPCVEPLILRLKDILEECVDESFFLKDEQIEKIVPYGSYFTKPNLKGDLNTQCNRYSDPEKYSLTLNCAGTEKIILIGNTHPSGKGMNENIFDAQGLSPILNTNKGEGIKISDQTRIRRLTPRECLRLQNFPDSFNLVVSNSQLYKQAGNSMTVRVVKKIIQKIYEI